MEPILISPVVLLVSAILALAALILAVRLLPLSTPDPFARVPLRSRVYQVLLILAVIGSGMALPLLGVAWARLYRVPPKAHVWGLIGLGVLQSAIGVVLFAMGRPDEGTLPAARSLFRRWGLPVFVLVAGLVWMALGLTALFLPARVDATPGTVAEPGTREEPGPVDRRPRRDEDDGRQTLIGIVQDGEFRILAPPSAVGFSARLTGIAMQESVPPESREIDLRDYEGSALLVYGRDGGGWIYEAEVIDQGGPLLTEIAERVFR
jgi:hypothetical protein